jgi:hypothetical protein
MLSSKVLELENIHVVSRVGRDTSAEVLALQEPHFLIKKHAGRMGRLWVGMMAFPLEGLEMRRGQYGGEVFSIALFKEKKKKKQSDYAFQAICDFLKTKKNKAESD